MEASQAPAHLCEEDPKQGQKGPSPENQREAGKTKNSRFSGCPGGLLSLRGYGNKAVKPLAAGWVTVGPLSCHGSGHSIPPGWGRGQTTSTICKTHRTVPHSEPANGPVESSRSSGAFEREDSWAWRHYFALESFFHTALSFMEEAWPWGYAVIHPSGSWTIPGCKTCAQNKGKCQFSPARQKRTFLSPPSHLPSRDRAWPKINSPTNTGLGELLGKSSVLKQESVIWLANFIIICLHGLFLYGIWKIIILLWNNGKENELWSQTGLISSSVFPCKSVVFKVLFNFL